MKEREKFGSRLGFILVSAGCAVGLGNVWKFPYITGIYGGAAFILIYLLFLVILGLPIIVMEFAVGRGSQKSAASSFRVLEPEGTKWHLFGYIAMAGNYLLMMFYTMVGGWMLYYCFKSIRGDFIGLNPDQIAGDFGEMLGSPGTLTVWTVIAVLISFGICSMGLKNGVEKITKIMMICLIALMAVLAVRSITLEGAGEGLSFYLKPDFGRAMEQGLGNVVFAAMGQAFFTLSIGMGSMAIFGSYLDKSRSLTGEAISITALDTLVALLAGIIIIPACFAFGVEPGAGPSLIFITLPNIFNHMTGSRLWGGFFFLFLSFAALTTIVAVFENIISYAIDLWNWERKKAVLINIVAIIVLSMPCILGFNVWSGFQPIGAGTNIMDLEDFIVSNHVLPLGSMVYLMFCTYRYGWGWKGFIEEANTGEGRRFPAAVRGYVSYILPLIVLVIFFKGYWDKFHSATAMIVAAAIVLGLSYIVFYRKKGTIPREG
ncbi:MAG: sodium-dependent transporter [Clostridiales bacterium]|jgi:NSS family neurotransmitter:Na+ symporter|nr:sodium-dependent transporter [Clostridiales bacterium]